MRDVSCGVSRESGGSEQRLQVVGGGSPSGLVGSRAKGLSGSNKPAERCLRV